MLTAMREGVKKGITKFILLGFMAMAVFGLVLMDVGGVFTGGINRGNVVEVDGRQMSAQEFDQTTRRILARQGLDPQTAYQLGMIDQIVQSEISNALMQSAADDLGLQVSDEMLIEQINRLLASFMTEGMSRRESLTRILMSQGMSEAEFASAIRSEMTNTLVRNALQISTAYTPVAEAQDLYRYRNEERTIDTMLLENSHITDLPEAGDDVLLPLYQAGRERFAIPETRTITMAVLTQETLAATMDVSEEELRQVYQQDINIFSRPERRVIQQAVVSDHATAEEIAATARTGTALEQAARQVTGGESAYLGEQSFEQEGLLEEIATAAFGAEVEPGTVIGPVRTALGWHVLYLSAIREPEVQPFSEVRDALHREILQNRLADEMFLVANQIDDRLAGGVALEEVAEEMEMELVSFGPVQRDGAKPDRTEGLRQYQQDQATILQTAFDMFESESSPVFELSGGEYAALRVDDISRKTYRPFEEVRDEIAAMWRRDQQDVLNRQRTQQALRDLATGERSLAAIAAEHNATVRTVTLKRTGEVPAPLTGAARTKFFETPRDEYNFASAEGGYVIGMVRDINIPEPPAPGSAALNEITETATRGSQDETLITYLDHLRAAHTVKVNERLLQSMYGPGSGDQRQF